MLVRYAILGPVELCDRERRVAVGGVRQMALLALLLVNANRTVTADRLIEAVWNDRAPAGARKRLQVAIARLRSVLEHDGPRGGSVLRTVAGGYLLAVRPGELDAEVFLRRVGDGRAALEAGEPERARDVLREALAMWRGPALAGVAYAEFAQPEVRHLEELRLAALETRVECELQLSERSGLIGELDGLVAAHPARERLAGQLMLALYRCGRQGDALDVYARTRAHLSGELGHEPGPALRSLQAEILAQSPALQWGTGEPAVAAAVVGTAPGIAVLPRALPLPRPLHGPPGSPFVGREPQLAGLRALWQGLCGGQRAAIVIGGEPGIGKTRLAGELARAAHGNGAIVLYGCCDEDLAVPYQPFVEALRPYVHAVGVDRVHADLGDLAPELGRLLPGLAVLGEPVRADLESERFALFDAVAALVEAMTRHQRVLLVLDDLHRASNPALLLLRHLIRSERPLGMLLLSTYRDTELHRGQPLARLLADLQRDASATRLHIGGLDEDAIALLVDAALAPAPHTRAELARVVAAQTGGNPLLIRELLTGVRDADRPGAGAEAA